MALPAQIQKQKEAVDKMFEGQNGEEGGGDTADKDTSAAPADAGPTITATPKESASKPAAEEHRQSDGGGDNSFEQRYRTLQGMYNAEVPRLRAEKQELDKRVTQMEELLQTINSSSTQTGGQEDDAKPLLTEEDIEDYGDSIDVMRRVYKEEARQQQKTIDELTNLVRQMQTTVVPTVNQLSQQNTVNSGQKFWDDLQQYVPDWQTTNDDPDFQSWLLDTDPLTGIARQTHLEAAQQNLDAKRVAAFFTAWKGNSVPAARENRAARTSSELEKQVSPGRGRSGSGSQTSEPKTYTPQDIAAFYRDVSSGKYAGRNDERAAVERDIFAAQQDGRIVNG